MSQCGGKIVVEFLGLYGNIHYVCKDGAIGHRLRCVKYDNTEGVLYYCSDCGENFDEIDAYLMEVKSASKASLDGHNS